MSSKKSETSAAAALEDLSALVDGELGAPGVTLTCAQWRTQSEVRQAWHTYQLIGDVLRSGDLATAPGRDEAFLQTLRTRLAEEPVVLSPAAVADEAATPSLPIVDPRGAPVTGRRTRWSWMAPSAVAAGFVAVAGVVLVTRAPVEPASGIMAQSPGGAATPVAARLQTQPQAPGAAPVAVGPLLRDARLDRYLNAHKEFAGSAALPVPSGYLRNAMATEATSR